MFDSDGEVVVCDAFDVGGGELGEDLHDVSLLLGEDVLVVEAVVEVGEALLDEVLVLEVPRRDVHPPRPFTSCLFLKKMSLRLFS